MADLSRGKDLFTNLVEYPLPDKRPQVLDCVCFCLDNKGYGKAARTFFKRWYPNHKTFEPTSLEHLITLLDAHCTQNGVQQIRELVIVAHGTPLALNIKLLDSVTAPKESPMGALTAWSLACLQTQMRGNSLPTYSARRSRVVARLQNDSWITVRACNFGQSNDHIVRNVSPTDSKAPPIWPKKGMYALFSFFGGRANVYAPSVFQFFGDYPVVPDLRFPDRLSVHDHLARQRFFPNELRTPERQDAIVKNLVNPAAFSDPFQIAVTQDSAPNPQYLSIVQNLNQRTANNPTLKAQFAANDFALSDKARVEVDTPDVSWLIRDVIPHIQQTPSGSQETQNFPVEYHVREDRSASGHVATLFSQGRLVAPRFKDKQEAVAAWGRLGNLVFAYSTPEYFMLQLLLDQSNHDAFIGKLGMLAAWSEAPNDDPRNKARLDAIVAILNSNGPQGQTFSDASGTDIRAVFNGEPNFGDYQWSDTATISAVSQTSWRVTDAAVRYLIKVETPNSLDGFVWHAVFVYLDLDQTALERHQLERIAAMRGSVDSDEPGVELVAYMDRHTIDELLDLIAYLRSTYKPSFAIYIYHAQQAIQRKRVDFPKWFSEHFDKNNVLWPENPVELTLSENDDRNAMGYAFDFDAHWSEVKAGAFNPLTVPQTDLFLEEPLGPKMGIPDDPNNPGINPCSNPTLSLDDESPATDQDELKQFELASAQLAKLAATNVEKNSIVDRPPDDTQTGCDDFKKVLETWKQVQGLPPDQILERLNLQETAEGKSYFEIILGLGEHYNFVAHMAELTELIHLPTVPTNAYLLGKLVAKRIPFLAHNVLLHALFEIDLVIMIPWELWKQFLEEQERAEEMWKNLGKLTAIRRWLGRLILATYFNTFPDNVDDLYLGLLQYAGSAEYWVAHFVDEQIENGSTNPLRVVFFPDEFKQEYDTAARNVSSLWIDISKNADAAIDELLHQLNFDGCKIQALIDAGLLDFKKIKGEVVRQLARGLLDKLPKV
jgi:hypothetical protein